jgi:hypothetical protein
MYNNCKTILQVYMYLYFKLFFSALLIKRYISCILKINVKTVENFMYILIISIKLKKNYVMYMSYGHVEGHVLGMKNHRFWEAFLKLKCKIQKIGNPTRNLHHNDLSHTICLKMS